MRRRGDLASKSRSRAPSTLSARGSGSSPPSSAATRRLCSTRTSQRSSARYQASTSVRETCARRPPCGPCSLASAVRPSLPSSPSHLCRFGVQLGGRVPRALPRGGGLGVIDSGHRRRGMARAREGGRRPAGGPARASNHSLLRMTQIEINDDWSPVSNRIQYLSFVKGWVRTAL
ncbi:hypothetical protein T492DRAFT_50872 [Pavlovales sp. CCMP2436]|nr:hypothetical protein T492DRAFT_50872 [Pavlovales sp. CCMP2436]